MYNLTHERRLLRKVLYRIRSEGSSFSNDLWFFSLHIAQKMHNKATFHAFLIFFSTNKSCHPKRVYLPVEDITQATPNKENNNCHETLCLGTVKEDVINGFFLDFTKKAFVYQQPSFHLKLF